MRLLEIMTSWIHLEELEAVGRADADEHFF